ncbi:MAG: response regulator [Candidatus Delongbacteria bacterium]|nr:response regulator [Candidatus Delongbacteria bacterium]
MKSIRGVFTQIELISLVIALALIILIAQFLHRNVRDSFLADQLADINKIDIIIGNYVRNSVRDFESHLGLGDNKGALGVLSGFSDIYALSDQQRIARIIKKDPRSRIFSGYSIAGSRLNTFLKAVKSQGTIYSPIIRSIEDEQLSLYIVSFKPDGTWVGRISLGQLNQDLIELTEYNQSLILITSPDGYVISSTRSGFPLNVLPPITEQTIRIGDDNYFFSRLHSAMLENDIVLLTPESYVFRVYKSLSLYFLYLMVLLGGSVILKIILQYYLFLRPIGHIAQWLRIWDINRREMPYRFYRYREPAMLLEAFSEKSQQIAQAIDKIRRNEEELDQIRLYLKNIIDSMPSILISVDRHGRIQEWNYAAEVFTGIPALKARNNLLVELIPVLKNDESLWQEVFNSGQQRYVGRKVITRMDDRYMDISIFPLTGSRNEEIAIRMDDVTELEKVENQLRQTQKMETIGTMVGGLAHDFNNLLMGIIGTISLIKHEFLSPPAGIPLRLQDYIKTIEQAGERASDMVKQLLMLVSKQDLTFEPVDLVKVIRQIVAICQNTFDRKILIRSLFSHEVAMCYGDVAQIEQVLLNLAVNAMHAMTLMRNDPELAGGVLQFELSLALSDSALVTNHPELSDISEFWQISVRDSGVGMEPKILSKIFDPFFSTKEKGRGTGLGLTMVYNSIHQHRGLIEVESQPGQGSVFHIFLPALLQVDPPEMAGEIPQNLEAMGTILMIDDEEDVRNVVVQMLEHIGYDVLQAQDGQAGISLFDQHRSMINLVILDMNMPVMSGSETFKRIREIDPMIRVIIASGFVHDERTEDMMKYGRCRFLQKPYTMDDLIRIIYQVMLD